MWFESWGAAAGLHETAPLALINTTEDINTTAKRKLRRAAG